MKTRQVFLIAIIVIFISGMFSPVFSQTTGRGKMYGTVTDADSGEPIEGVTIKLFFPGSNQFHKPFPKTDKEGKWIVKFVRSGRWDLDFVKPGYEVKKISFHVDTTPGTKKVGIDVQLRKLEGPAAGSEVVKGIENAQALIAEKNYDKALDVLSDLLEKHKEDMGIEIVNLYIGNCYAMKGDYNKAIEYYQKSLEKFPKNKELILAIGNAYNNLNDHDNAMKWFNKLAIDDIGNVDTLYNIAVIAYNQGDFERAASFFKKSTEIDAAFADGYYQLGMTYTALDKQKEAVEVLKKFMELAPDSPDFETAKAIVDAFKDAK
jgi:lipopolysaccharide biosynthesis regulator YciM